MEKVKEILKDARYNMASMIFVECLGVREDYQREEKDNLLRHWGKEEGRADFINTRTLRILIY